MSVQTLAPMLMQCPCHMQVQDEYRVHWLVDNHVRPMFEGLRDQLQRLQATGAAVAGNPALLTFMAMTAAGLFAQAAEFELLSGRDPRSPEVVEEYADLLGSILIPGATPSEP